MARMGAWATQAGWDAGIARRSTTAPRPWNSELRISTQARFSPPKISDTEESSNTAPMASEINLATVNTSSLSK